MGNNKPFGTTVFCSKIMAKAVGLTAVSATVICKKNEVCTIAGPVSVRPGDSVEYSVAHFNNPPFFNDKARVSWAVFIEGEEVYKYENAERLRLTIKREWENKKITVWAWLNNREKAAKLTTQIGERRIVIVIDPGHGVRPGNVGTQARLYTYKLQDEYGEVKKDEDENAVTNSLRNVLQLPQYVLDDPDTWIVGNNLYRDVGSSDITRHTLETRLNNARFRREDRTVGHHLWSEYTFAFDMARIIMEKLQGRGYEVHSTRDAITTNRDDRNIIRVANNSDAIEFRNRFSNQVEADYFISLHADGDETMGFASGAHVMYDAGRECGEEFAKDLFNSYGEFDDYGEINIITSGSRKHPRARTNYGVLSSRNRAQRKALIEFGFMTNPSDARLMFTQEVKELMADQIIEGLERNISKFKQSRLRRL